MELGSFDLLKTLHFAFVSVDELGLDVEDAQDYGLIDCAVGGVFANVC